MRDEIIEMRNELESISGQLEHIYSVYSAMGTYAENCERLAAEAEHRSAEDRGKLEELSEKAARTDALEEACVGLLDALDRLPLRMEDAGIMQTVVPPAIPLYGTHDWKAVMDAKQALASVLTPRKEN